MRRLLIVPILFVLLCSSTMFADYVHKWTDNSGGCTEWMTVEKEGYGCMNFRRPCGSSEWTNIGNCGWEESCNGRVIPANAISSPFVLATSGGILVTVAPSMGGYFTPLGSPSTCDGHTIYTRWEFHADGTDYIKMPAPMVQL